MANVVIPNNNYQQNGNLNECVWRLTRAMKKAGWQTVSSSDGTTKVAPATNNTDSWGNNADPSLDIYPASFTTLVPWIVMRGPSTVKIPIIIAPTGTPIRGEKVTQGSAEGELLGYVFDDASVSGWMVVLPRVGTFTTASAISCPVSGASFTPGGVIVTFVREFMFARNSTPSNLIDAQIFYICADVVAENAQLYSTIATSAGCTASVAPGCAVSGGNLFPALGIAVKGTAGVTAPLGSPPFGGLSGSGGFGSYHVACANAIGAANVSPDGSFYVVGTNATSNQSLTGFGYTRVDDGDPGDCDPYVVLISNFNGIANWSRTSNVGAPTVLQYSGQIILTNNSCPFVGYQARGCPVVSRDLPNPYFGSAYYNVQANGNLLMISNYPQTVRTLNHPSSVPPISRENVMIWSPGFFGNAISSQNLKHYKGRARWIAMISKGNVLSTYDNKNFICTSTATSQYPAIVIGPWDGITTPLP